MSKLARALAALALPAALAAGAAAHADPAQPITVNFTLGDNRYDPPNLELRAGQAYILHMTNIDHVKHGFEAKEFFDTVTTPDWAKGRVKNGDVEVWAHQWTDIAFTPNTPGDYPLHSPDPMNELLGMKGHIIVH
jgi:plastocyanin